jgi:hypothetical protein
MKARPSVLTGILGFLFGAVVAAALVTLLYIGVGPRGGPRGGETVFKIAWSAAVFGFGPLGAIAFPLAIGGRRLQPEALVLAIVVALALYGLAAWMAADWLSFINDCGFGVRWPTPTGCGPD